MFFHQFYLGCLAHASYMLGSDGIAAVVDPQRDVEIYLEEAARQGLRITYVIETHLHADFVSGHRELAARTGAEIYVGRAANAKFPHHGVVEGDEIRFGRCILRFLETPGHTVESLCVLVTDLDRDRSAEPFAVLTGDTLFIGDVGRPDLSPDHTPQQLAAMLYHSLHGKLLGLPDSVEVYPAHGAGSLCGRNISQQRQSTIGEQRRMNYALKPMAEQEFVSLMTAEFAARPGYFIQDAEINREGAPSLNELPAPPALTPEDIEFLSAKGAIVRSPARAKRSAGETTGERASPAGTIEEVPILLDVRSAAQFCAGHVPGSINIGLGGQFASWAATIIGLERQIILVADGTQEVAEARTRLARVGIENVIGYLDGSVEAWQRSGRALATIPQISAADLAAELGQHPGSVQVLDVRRAAEWSAGHIAEAIHVPLDNLGLAHETSQIEQQFASLRRDQLVAVHCKSGYRSAIACGILERAGFRNVINVVGGFDAWQAAKLPVTTLSDHVTA